MTSVLTRRRFLTIAAATTACGVAPAQAQPIARWQGQALGATTSMQLAGQTPIQAQAVFRAVERELVRLERIFSLYVPESEISRLNRSGVLHEPAPELLEVLTLCDALHQATQGAFDPTIQPVWQAYAQAGRASRAPSPAAQHRARALVGWHRVQISRAQIGLTVPGMALTLNGVAQGYITDRISALLVLHGLRDVLIDMGEVAATGMHPDGRPWLAGVADADGQIVNRIRLQDRALATSAPNGTRLNTSTGHILDPRTAGQAPRHMLVSISSNLAAVADGLSTAGCLMTSPQLTQALAAFPGTQLETII